MCRIVTDADVREGLTAFTAACPHLARVHAETCATPPLRKRPKGFEGLARIILG
jgi:DNA-3-methyladenine glycosylase II